jgi:tetratricopeptide (TPR) repeat protein
MSRNTYENKPQFLSNVNHCIARGAPEEAKELSEQWLIQYPGDVDVRLCLGRALIAMDRNDHALAVLKDVEQTVLQLGSVYIYMADIYRHLQENHEALSCYIRYLDLFPDSEKAQEVTEKMNSLLGIPEQELSNEDGHKNIQAVSSDFHTLTLAELYVKQGHVDSARDILKSILARNPGNVMAAKKLNELEAIFNHSKSEICEVDHKKSRIISELTIWLNNINRLRNRMPVH